MKEISDMMDGVKVLHNPFTEFVCDFSLKEFLVKFRYPFLFGQDLLSVNFLFILTIIVT